MALDVFSTEPLPQDSPLWSLPWPIFSPHISGDADDFEHRLGAQFVANSERFAGEPLTKVVDKRLDFVAR